MGSKFIECKVYILQSLKALHLTSNYFLIYLRGRAVPVDLRGTPAVANSTQYPPVTTRSHNVTSVTQKQYELVFYSGAIGNLLEEWSLRLLLFCWWFSVAFAFLLSDDLSFQWWFSTLTVNTSTCTTILHSKTKYFVCDDEVLRTLSTNFVREDEVLRMRSRSTLYSKYFAVYFVRRSTSSTKTEYFVFEDEALYSRSTSKYFIEKWPCNRTPVDSSHNSYISTHSPFDFFLSALFWTNNQ